MKKDLKKVVHPLVLQHMWLGLSGVLGNEEAGIGPIYNDDEAQLRECFSEQEAIGWEHMVYGRLSKKWAVVNDVLMRRDGRATADTDSVAKALVEGYWQFGISVWTQRNQLEHGNQYSVSLLERERVQRCIKSAYDKFGSINNSDCKIK